MELFKTTDEKLRDIGFVKVGDDDHGAFYERLMPQGFVQEVALLRKYSGRHIIQSYEKGTDRVCGMTFNETRLFLRKMREIRLHKEDAR